MAGPQRVAVVGNSGLGESTLTRQLAARLDAEYIELDAIHLLPGWTPLDRDEMRRIVSERTEVGRRVVDGNYGSMVGDIVLGRADTCVWLDLPRRVVMPRVVWRTLRRAIRREELWNGDRERPRDRLKRDPGQNIILWSWTQVEAYRDQYRAEMARPANAPWRGSTSPRRGCWRGGWRAWADLQAACRRRTLVLESSSQ